MSDKYQMSADEILEAAGLDPETGAEPVAELEPSEQEKIAKAMEMLIAENAEL